MNQPNTRVDRLKQMLALEERRSTLQNELDSLVQQLHQLKDQLFDDNAPALAAPVRKVAPAAAAPASGGRRGGRRPILKEKIMAALQSAGSNGVIVKDLAAAIGINPVNVHSWFHSALKRPDSGIIKISGGHYKLGRGGSSSAAPSAPAPKKAPRGKRKGMKRGELTANILATLKAAGGSGVTVTDLSKQLGANYRNIYIWFATTGKKFKQVQKAGPATYKYVG